MSEQAINAAAEEAVALDAGPLSAFASLMDTLVPEEGAAEGAEGSSEVPADAPAAGQPAAPAEGAGAEGVDAGAPAGGDAGSGAVPAGEAGTTPPADAGTDPAPGVDYSTVAPKFGEISVALEENVTKAHQQQALADIKAEHGSYFDALQKHPRLLVGTTVPSVKPDVDTEVLRDSADAKDWQDAVKALLADEIRSRAASKIEEERGRLEVLHSSIEVFQNNGDMVPGTKQFDRELADRVTKFAKPYEVRENGKLIGWSIPIQPLVEQERQALAGARAAKPAAQPAAQAPAGQKAAPGQPAAPAAPKPQAGIQSRAGQSTGDEDFSTLFGTLGLPGLRI